MVFPQTDALWRCDRPRMSLLPEGNTVPKRARNSKRITMNNKKNIIR